MCFVQICCFNCPQGTALQLTALGAPYRTVLTQGNKGETTQDPCVKIIPLRRTICSQFWRQSICNKSICFLIDDILFPFKETTTSFCRPAGHVICGSNAKANTRVTFRAKGSVVSDTVWLAANINVRHHKPSNGWMAITE